MHINKKQIMKRIFLFIFSLFLLSLSFSQPSTSQPSTKVYYFEIDDNISKPALRKTEKAVAKSIADSADILFLRLNTFGGELEAAEQIRTLLLEAPIPVYVFIDPNAASAGALISIACDSIYMSPGASIGAASVVNQTGEILPDKYQSYMRSLMRSTAEENGRNPLIAQAMVDPDTYIKGVIDSGKVLTFTTQEAIKHGYCEGEATSFEAIMELAQIDNYEVEKQKLTWIDKIISFLINPAISGLLIMCIIGGIYFELQTPGIGFPLIVALMAAVLYFMPHYLEGLAAHWEILLFIVGIILLLLEIFVTPGFGVLGISGIVLMVTALVLTMIFNIGFDFQFSAPKAISTNILIVMTSIIVGFLLSLWLGKKLLLTNTRYGSLSLNTELDNKDGFVAQDMNLLNLIGQEGSTLTLMRPAGKIEIDGEIYDAVATNGYIEQGEKIIVTRFENAQLVIDKSNI